MQGVEVGAWELSGVDSGFRSWSLRFLRIWTQCLPGGIQEKGFQSLVCRMSG